VFVVSRSCSLVWFESSPLCFAEHRKLVLLIEIDPRARLERKIYLILC